MPLGAGLTNQSCLYTETFIIRMINERVSNPGPVRGLYEHVARTLPSPRAQVAKAMRFYMGGPGVQDKIAEEIYNINSTAIKAINQTIQPVRDWLQTPPGQVFINSFPNATAEVAELRQLLGELGELRENNTSLEDTIQQSGFQTLYQVRVYVVRGVVVDSVCVDRRARRGRAVVCTTPRTTCGLHGRQRAVQACCSA